VITMCRESRWFVIRSSAALFNELVARLSCACQTKIEKRHEVEPCVTSSVSEV
jgi:hypothetical protein